VAERLVKLLARTISDERDLRAITESRQPSGEIILRGRRDLCGCRQKWNQEEEKESETGVQELQEFRSYGIDRMRFGPLGGREFLGFLFDSSPALFALRRSYVVSDGHTARRARPEGA